MICERCGREVADSAAICPNCGTVTSFGGPSARPQTNYGESGARAYGNPAEPQPKAMYDQGYKGYPQQPEQNYGGFPQPPQPGPGYGSQQSGYIPPQPGPGYGSQQSGYMASTYQAGSTNYSVVNNFVAPVAPQKNNGALIAEIILSLFGIYGVGWLMAGETTVGVVLLICSFVVFWPVMVGIDILTVGLGIFLCNLPLAIGGIILNAVLLNKNLTRKAMPPQQSFVNVQQGPPMGMPPMQMPPR